MSALKDSQDFQDCLSGEHGPEWKDLADAWMEQHAGDTDGTAWMVWCQFRQAAGAA